MECNLWGREIRAYRFKQGIKQAELGDLLGVDPTTISRWERGLIVPNLKRQRKIRDLMRSEHDDKNLRALLASPIGCIEAGFYDVHRKTVVCMGGFATISSFISRWYKTISRQALSSRNIWAKNS